MYDLLIRGGRVIDPSQGLNDQLDVAVGQGVIQNVAPELPVSEATQVINVSGKIVIPGIVDIHTHTADGITRSSANPDLVGVYSGVTTLVEAGSCGSCTFQGMARYVVPAAKTEVLCFLNIARTGLAYLPEVRDMEDIDLEDTVRTVQSSNGLIRGIKLRAMGPGVRTLGFEMARLAKEAARRSGVRLMVHIGDWSDPKATYRSPENTNSMTRDVLNYLDPGDIVTHLFTSYPNGILNANGKVIPEVKDAKYRGVYLDTAHGRYNFSFEAAHRVLDQGVVPDGISTDITAPGRLKPVYSMTEMMTRFLALGFTLEQVVSMTTINPAKALGLSDRLGSLAKGHQADVSVLELHQGKWTVYDVMGSRLMATQALTPVLTVKRGEVFSPMWGPHPWGWLPEPS